MRMDQIKRAIDKANWPLTLQIAPIHEFVFEGHGPVGLTVADTQQGVVVREVSDGSKAQQFGVPIGGLIVAVHSGKMEKALNTALCGKEEVGKMLLGRPLTVQIVPRDVAYLIRPEGVYHRRSKNRDEGAALGGAEPAGCDDGGGTEGADAVAEAADQVAKV